MSEGLNVVTGPSDAGKTAIIRAIRWVAFGEPAGDAFVNQAVGYAEVAISLSNSVTIVKTRRGKSTAYEIRVPGQTPQVFEKAEVPEEVTALLGIQQQSFGDFETALNFAYQLDPPFLISAPASAGAKVLGKLAGTEIVDAAIKATSKETYAARQEVALAERQIKSIDTDLLQFLDLPEQKQQLEACEFLLGKAETATAKQEHLSQLHIQHDRNESKLAGIEETLQRYESVPILLSTVEQMEKTDQRLATLTGLADGLDRLASSITRLDEELTQYANLPTVENLLAKASASEDSLAVLNSLVREYQTAEQKANTADLILQQTSNVAELSGNISRIETCTSRVERLKTLEANFDTQALRVEQQASVLEATDGINELTTLLTAASGNLEKRQRLQSLLVQYETNQLLLAKYCKTLEDTEKVAELTALLASVTEKQDRLTVYQQLYSSYQMTTERMQSAERAYENADSAVTESETQIKTLWAEIKVCPLCEKELEDYETHGQQNPN